MGLIGKNEHGTTLSSAALGAVIESWAIYFNPEASQHAALPSGMMHLAHRVETALISDANKVIAIKDEALLDSLLAGLLVDEDNPRRGAEAVDGRGAADLTVVTKHVRSPRIGGPTPPARP